MNTLEYRKAAEKRKIHWLHRYCAGVPLIAVAHFSSCLIAFLLFQSDRDGLASRFTREVFNFPFVGLAISYHAKAFLVSKFGISWVMILVAANSLTWGFVFVGGWHVLSAWRRNCSHH